MPHRHLAKLGLVAALAVQGCSTAPQAPDAGPSLKVAACRSPVSTTPSGGLAQRDKSGGAENALTEANFVDLGDQVVHLLDSSRPAVTSLLISTGLAGPAWMNQGGLHWPSEFASASRVKRACPGGGHVHVRMRDADRSGDLSARDRFTAEFDNCVTEDGTLSGRGDVAVTARRVEGSLEITEIDIDFHAFGTPAARWTGKAQVRLSVDPQRGSGQRSIALRDVSLDWGDTRTRWNATLDIDTPPGGEQTATVQGVMHWGAMTLQLQQNEPFILSGSGLARAGRLTAHDGLGGRLGIEAGRWRYTYRLHLPGNTSERPDSSSQSQPTGERHPGPTR